MKAVILLLLVCLVFGAVPIRAIQPDNGDVNCDDAVNVLDIIYMIDYKFKTGPEPCNFISPGVAYVHIDNASPDIGISYTTLISTALYAPDDGFAVINYSFYTTTDYCLELNLFTGVPRDNSVVYELTTDSPMSWTETVYVYAGYNEISLHVRGCVRGEDEPDKATVNFNNINLTATYFPEYYGPRDGESGEAGE